MTAVNPSLRELARRLLAAETVIQPADAPHAQETTRVFETFREMLTRLAGPEGFSALLRRALALARAEMPGLPLVPHNAGAAVANLGEIVAGVGSGKQRDEAAVTIFAHLLGLLVTFLGEALTMRLVSEAWPNVPLADHTESRPLS